MFTSDAFSIIVYKLFPMYNLISLFYTVNYMVFSYLIIITKPKTKPKTIEIIFVT